MKSHRVDSVDDITNEYTKRIVSNIIGKNPLKVLDRTPGRLEKLIKGLKGKQLRYQPAPGKWSIVQIVSHLTDAEFVLAWRLRMALAQSGSPLQAMDQDKWTEGLNYQGNDAKEQVKLFSAVRNQHLRMWNSLTDEQWQFFGMHEERGKETVERIMQHYAGHDLNHLRQIEAIRDELKSDRRKKK